MGRDDWFRNSEWNESIERGFEERLRRARKKSQYLRIQADYLAGSHPLVSLQLLERYFLLEEKLCWAQAYCGQASAFLALGRIDDAIISYERALDREKEFPNVKSRAYIDLPFLIATNGLRERFDRAVQILRDNQSQLTFPVDRFMWHAALALIAKSRGDSASASEHASLALIEAGQEHSGFRFHPTIGLVPERYRALIVQLAAISKKATYEFSGNEKPVIREWLTGVVRRFSK